MFICAARVSHCPTRARSWFDLAVELARAQEDAEEKAEAARVKAAQLRGVAAAEWEAMQARREDGDDAEADAVAQGVRRLRARFCVHLCCMWFCSRVGG